MTTEDVFERQREKVAQSDPEEQRRLFRETQRQILGDHFFLSSIVFSGVWRFGTLAGAESYALGAIFGAFYLTLLARYVESVGGQSFESVRSAGVGQARFAVVGLLVLLAGKNPTVFEFIPLLTGFFTYQISSFLQAFRPADS